VWERHKADVLAAFGVSLVLALIPLDGGILMLSVELQKALGAFYIGLFCLTYSNLGTSSCMIMHLSIQQALYENSLMN